jgi:hypothetical protein
MTAETVAVRPPRRGLSWSDVSDDLRQLIGVLLLAVVAVAIGLGLRVVAEGESRTIDALGVTASIPAGWVFSQGAGDLAFTVQDPRNAGQRYQVSLIRGETDPAAAAATQTAAKGRLLERFEILDRSSPSIGGRDTLRVHYVYVTDGPGGIPQVIEGIDDFVRGTNGILVISLASPTRGFVRAIDDFERFAATVRG